MPLRTLKEGSLARQVDIASTRYHYTTYKVGRTLRCQLMGARHLFSVQLLRFLLQSV